MTLSDIAMSNWRSTKKREIFQNIYKSVSFKNRSLYGRVLNHIHGSTAVSSAAPCSLLMLHFSLCSGHTLWRWRGTRGTRMVKHFSHFFQLLVEKYFLENHNCSLSHQMRRSKEEIWRILVAASLCWDFDQKFLEISWTGILNTKFSIHAWDTVTVLPWLATRIVGRQF